MLSPAKAMKIKVICTIRKTEKRKKKSINLEKTLRQIKNEYTNSSPNSEPYIEKATSL